MDINVTAAAQRLGVSEPSVRTMIASGRLPRQNAEGAVRVSAADVDRVRSQRRNEALRRHPDVEGFAQEIRRILWPLADAEPETVELYDGRTDHYGRVDFGHVPASGMRALVFLPADAAAVFGPDVLQAAAGSPAAFKDVCRWCFADAAARVHETLRPENTPAYRLLLGDPCERDRARFTAEEAAARTELARLKARMDASTRQAEKDRAHTEYDAAQRGASGAAARLRHATEALVRVDPSSAATVASGAAQAARRRSRLDCPCTTETLCADHARQLAAKRGRR